MTSSSSSLSIYTLVLNFIVNRFTFKSSKLFRGECFETRYVFFLCLDFKLIYFTSTAFCTILTQFDVFQGPFYKLCRAETNLFIFAKARLSTAYKMEFRLNRAKSYSTAQVAEALFIKPNVEPSRAWACTFYNSFLNKPYFFACKPRKLFMRSFREQHVKKLK